MHCNLTLVSGNQSHQRLRRHCSRATLLQLSVRHRAPRRLMWKLPARLCAAGDMFRLRGSTCCRSMAHLPEPSRNDSATCAGHSRHRESRRSCADAADMAAHSCCVSFPMGILRVTPSGLPDIATFRPYMPHSLIRA